MRLPKRPEGMRKVNYVFLNPADRRKKGVYLLHIGDKYYVGRASNIGSRMNKHWHTETMAMADLFYGREHNHTGSTKRIAQYLYENWHITEVFVELLAECETVEECIGEEDSWLRAIAETGFHDFFLNAYYNGKHFYTEPDDPRNSCWADGFMLPLPSYLQ